MRRGQAIAFILVDVLGVAPPFFLILILAALLSDGTDEDYRLVFVLGALV